jgi:Holliday junction resolvase RusA-like endonuclease
MIWHGFYQGKPIPQGSKTAMVINGKAVMFEANKNHKSYRAALEKWFDDASPTSNPVRVELVFYFVRPKSSKRELPSVKPDIDKLCRTVLDAATGRLFKDDSQVVILNARKEYAPAEGVLVRCFDITDVTIR